MSTMKKLAETRFLTMKDLKVVKKELQLEKQRKKLKINKDSKNLVPSFRRTPFPFSLLKLSKNKNNKLSKEGSASLLKGVLIGFRLAKRLGKTKKKRGKRRK